jgi:hypothetical protein
MPGKMGAATRSLVRVGAETSGFLESTRRVLKPPKLLAMQIQKPKMKVVLLSSTVLVKLRDAFEFSGGCLINTPIWRASCRCFTATPIEGYPM